MALFSIEKEITKYFSKTRMEAPGFEPGAFRMRSGHSTTELCPLQITIGLYNIKRQRENLYHNHYQHKQTKMALQGDLLQFLIESQPFTR